MYLINLVPVSLCLELHKADNVNVGLSMQFHNWIKIFLGVQMSNAFHVTMQKKTPSLGCSLEQTNGKCCVMFKKKKVQVVSARYIPFGAY